jgi:isocitrate/isopropylmalate dehydrogenase
MQKKRADRQTVLVREATKGSYKGETKEEEIYQYHQTIN